MKILWALLLLLLVITTFFILISHIRIRVEANKTASMTWLHFDLYLLFGIIHIQKDFPNHKVITDSSSENENNHVKKELKQNKTNVKDILKHRREALFHMLSRMFTIIRKLLKHIKVEKLQWKSFIGTGDAAETGVLTGIAWSIKSTLVGYITSYLKLHTRPALDVTPMFHEAKMETTFLFDAKLRVGYALFVGLKLMIVAWRSRKMIGKFLRHENV